MSAAGSALPENGRAISVAGTRRQTLYFLLGGLLLAIATPAIVALTQPGARFYLLQPMIFGIQVVPYVVAAALWLPWRSPRTSRIGLLLARVLFAADLLLYLPVMTGLVPTGGDMIALGYLMLVAVTTASILVVTLAAFAVSWAVYRSRRAAPR